jgi:tRNA-5-methyluridine54 2-sulfurtransferase
MKCRVCGNQASISLKAYNTALCDDDFVEFLERRVATTIRKYGLLDGKDRPVVAVSGGKDSLSLWYILTKLGYEADGMYVNLGIGDYSELSFERIKAMADTLGRKVHVFSVAHSFRKGIEGLARAMRRTPCSACGMIKRYAMNRVAVEKGYKVLATGHNLDDEAGALLGNLLYWREEYLWRKNVSLEATEGHLAKKVKPFFLCSEREVAAYAIIRGIDYIYDECPYAKGANSIVYKNLLNGLEEESPGTKIMFVQGYLKKTSERVKGERRYCETCGYPAFGDLCNFCRTIEKYGSGEPFTVDEYGPAVLDRAEEMVT